MYVHITHIHSQTRNIHDTRICTCVGWFPVPLLTLLLHTTWPFYWTLTLVYYTQRSTTMFIFTIHNTDVLCICNCNACCPESVAMSLGPVGRTHVCHARFNLVAFIFNMICFPGTDMLYLRLWLRGK